MRQASSEQNGIFFNPEFHSGMRVFFQLDLRGDWSGIILERSVIYRRRIILPVIKYASSDAR